MKKILLMGLSLVLVAVLAVGGTFAYLTDTDETVNVMTLGNVDIEHHEYQRVVNADGSYKTGTVDGQNSYVLEEVERVVAPLLPIVGDPSSPVGYPYAGYDSTPVRMSQVKSYGGMDVFAGKNAVDKFVTVENKGKTDAYVRTIVAIEVGSETDDLIGTSYHKTWTKTDIGTIAIDGINYSVTEYVYAGGQLSDGTWRHKGGVLPAGDTSYPNLSQVYIGSEANNADMTALDGNGNGTLDILVVSQAVQADGFDTAEAALTAGFGAVDAANVQAWFGDTEIPVTVDNDTELNTAITNGSTAVIMGSGNYIIPDSAQGKELTFIGNGDTVVATQDDGSYEGCDYSLDGATATFENITINTDSSTYTGYARMNGTYKNCTINGTYTLYGDSVFENCTFNVTGDVYNIWTWGAPTATFKNCTFNSDGKALLLYGTANTKLTVEDCTFNDNGGLTDKKAAIEIGNDYNKSYELIVKNTTVNGYEINDKGISTGTTLWANKNSMGSDKLNVVVDGVDVY